MRFVLLTLLFLASMPALAGDVQVLFVGMFHFDNPGLDYVKSDVPDVMSAERQKEIAAIVANLQRFKPTKVMVEWPSGKADALAQRYSDFRAGKYTLTRNETDQLGLRLAAAQNLETIHAIDVKGDMDIEGVMAYAQKNDPVFMAAFGKLLTEFLEPQRKMQVEKPLGETLRWINSPTYMRNGHAIYVQMARVGDAANPIGAEQTAVWYTRNIRIFANLARLAQPDDRIVVFYGAGHVPILEQLARDLPGMKVVAANDFL